MAIVFACPHCGANQSVDENETSTQCQFCGNTITVPENLRPKTPPQAAPAAPAVFSAMPSPQSFSTGGTVNISGMAGLPGMFMNMDVNKLRAMALAARNGDTTEAARLYQENFGVSPEDAMQAAQLMSKHHHIVLQQHMQFGTPTVIQMGSQPMTMNAPMSSASPIYNLPSPPVPGGSPYTRRGNRWAACIGAALVLIFAMGIAGALILSALARAR